MAHCSRGMMARLVVGAFGRPSHGARHCASHAARAGWSWPFPFSCGRAPARAGLDRPKARRPRLQPSAACNCPSCCAVNGATSGATSSAAVVPYRIPCGVQGWQTKYQAEVVKQMTTTRQQVEETAVLPRDRNAARTVSPPRRRHVAAASPPRRAGARCPVCGMVRLVCAGEV
jgi:hypothetical protein